MLVARLKESGCNRGETDGDVEGPSDENEFAKYEASFPFKEKAETDSQREFRFLASLRY